MRTGRPSASNARIQSIPLSPATAARQVSGAVFPTGVSAPNPVTATRRIAWSLKGGRLAPAAHHEPDLGTLLQALIRARALTDDDALSLLRGQASDPPNAAVGAHDRCPRSRERLPNDAGDAALD